MDRHHQIDIQIYSINGNFLLCKASKDLYIADVYRTRMSWMTATVSFGTLIVCRSCFLVHDYWYMFISHSTNLLLDV